MALSADRIAYGIHSILPRQRAANGAEGLPYGILKIVGGGDITFTAEFEDLFGGSQKFAWASEAKTIDSSFTSSVKSMPDFLFSLYMGAEVSTTAASAAGASSAVVDTSGTVVDATGLTAVITVDTDADVKAGKYLIKVVSATTVDIYAISSDIDFSEGTDLSFVDDALKITASPLTVTAATPTAIPSLGVSINGGAGVIGMSTGDLAVFELAKPHGGISDIVIGKSGITFPEHAFVAYGAKRADGSLFEMEAFKAVGSGFNVSLQETVFSIPELTVKLLYDTDLNAVARIRATAGV